MTEISVNNIVSNDFQPRKNFDTESIQELADSIRENGLLQPIIVESIGNGNYMLVGGERRLKAFQLLGKETIPAIIRNRRKETGGRDLLVHAVVENVQREDMHPLDVAAAYQRMHDEFGMTWDDVSAAVGKNPQGIKNSVYLNTIDEEIRELIRQNKLTHLADLLRQIMRIPDKDARVGFARKVAQERLTHKAIIAAAEKLTDMLVSERLSKDGDSPAMILARRKSPVTSKMEPSGWNALEQLGDVPPWSWVATSTTKTCDACSLSTLASDVTCKECPLVEFLVRVTNV